MLYTVYKTVDFTNGRYYIGVHKTNNPNDSYLGPGKVFMRAVAKHGKVNFRKDVLFIFNTGAEAFAKELELVDAAKTDPLCYNLRQGGNGGFDWINAQPEITKRRSVKNIRELRRRSQPQASVDA
jgi:hypothetical protein